MRTIFLSLCLGISLQAQEMNQYLNPSNHLTEAQEMAFYKRIMIDREPFLASVEAKKYPQTMNHFFHHEEYKALQGNPALGYWSIGQFAWPAGTVEVDFIPPKATNNETKAIKPLAWERAIAIIAAHHGLKIKAGAPIKITGAMVDATLVPTKDQHYCSLVAEWRVDSPTGPLLIRRGSAKKGLGDAIGANLDFVVGYAIGLGDGKNLQDPAKAFGHGTH